MNQALAEAISKTTGLHVAAVRSFGRFYREMGYNVSDDVSLIEFVHFCRENVS